MERFHYFQEIVDRTWNSVFSAERLRHMTESLDQGFELYWKQAKQEVGSSEIKILSGLIEVKIKQENNDSDSESRLKAIILINDLPESLKDEVKRYNQMIEFVEQMNRLSEGGFCCTGLKRMIFLTLFEEIQKTRNTEGFFCVFQLLMAYQELFGDLQDLLKTQKLFERLGKTLETITEMESECKTFEIYQKGFKNMNLSNHCNSFISKLKKVLKIDLSVNSSHLDFIIKLAKYLEDFTENLVIETKTGTILANLISLFKKSTNFDISHINIFECVQKSLNLGLKYASKANLTKLSVLKKQIIQNFQGFRLNELKIEISDLIDSQSKDLQINLSNIKELHNKHEARLNEELIKTHNKEKQELLLKISGLSNDLKSKEDQIIQLKTEKQHLTRAIEQLRTEYVIPFNKMKNDREIIEKNNSSLSNAISAKDQEFNKLLIQKQEIEKKFNVEVKKLTDAKEYLETKITESRVSQEVKNFLSAVESENELKNQIVAKERTIKRLLAEKKHEYSSFDQLSDVVKRLKQENKSLKSQLESCLFFNNFSSETLNK